MRSKAWVRAILTAAMTFLTARPGRAQTAGISFYPPANTTLLGGPSAMVTGDFNNDGKLDLAIDINNLKMYLGNGDGTFSELGRSVASPNSSAMASGDFNGDGNLDLALARGDEVIILLGTGAGTFTGGQGTSYLVGEGAAGVAVGDFNHDGKQDLVVANSETNDVSVLFGNGDGTFQTKVDYRVGTTPVSVAVADFNGDGQEDIAAVNSNGGGQGSVSILLNRGDGVFKRAVNYSVDSNPDWIAVADFNGDGIEDLAVANYGSDDVSVLLGNGDGTFQPAVNYSVGEYPMVVVARDFNDDGKPDLATVNEGAGTVSTLLGNGDGTFQPAVDFSTGDEPTTLVAGDFNGDGYADLATGDRTRLLSVLLNTGNAPLASLSPANLAFATQLLRTTSAPLSVTLTNAGQATLSISSIVSENAEFTQTNACGSTLAAGASCTVSVTFTPAQEGTRNGSITITDNSLGSPQTVPVKGTGSVVKLSANLSFGDVPVGTTSPPQNITLTNVGTTALSIYGITLTGADAGDFAQTNTCGSSVAAGASCTISVTFTPSATGSRAAAVSISDNGTGTKATQEVQLSGTGT